MIQYYMLCISFINFIKEVFFKNIFIKEVVCFGELCVDSLSSQYYHHIFVNTCGCHDLCLSLNILQMSVLGISLKIHHTYEVKRIEFDVCR